MPLRSRRGRQAPAVQRTRSLDTRINLVPGQAACPSHFHDGSTVSRSAHTPATPHTADTASDAGRRPSTGGIPYDVSVTVAAPDGTIIATITRHRDATTDDHSPAHDVIVVGIDGDVDLDSSPLLQIALTEALDAHPRVSCDLSRAAFFGATGANTLVAAHLHAKAAGRQFTVRGARSTTRWVLGITGLDQMLTVTE